MLLDINDPTKVLGRTLYPILEPELIFEREGIVNNVVFPCGSIKKGNDIYLYYGGGDRVVCGAKINLIKLLDYIEKSGMEKYLI
jgi:beta-1,2-mannobiose phosphorylase / 1,2-beta-oligomannan phosphorylase